MALGLNKWVLESVQNREAYADLSTQLFLQFARSGGHGVIFRTILLPGALFNRSMYHRLRGEYHSSIMLSKEQIELLQSSGQYHHAAARTSDLVEFYLKLGDFKSAESLIDQSIAVLKSRQSDLTLQGYPGALRVKADLLEYLMKFDEALPLRREALASEEKLESAQSRASVYLFQVFLARLLTKMERLEEAEELYDKVLEHIKHNKVRPMVEAGIADSVVLFYVLKGDLDKAEKYCDKAWELGGKTMLEGPAGSKYHFSKAILRMAQGRSKEAETLLTQAIESFSKQQSTDHPWLIKPLMQYHKLLLFRGQETGALAVEERIRKIASKYEITLPQEF